jgi:rhodanese-related sulfurtransferase
MRGPKNWVPAAGYRRLNMAQLLTFANNHPLLVGMAIAAAIAVLVYELRLRSQNAGAVSPQDAVRLMNQGATIIDVRPAEAFAAGHVRGARHLPMDKLGDASETFKRLKEKPVIVCCDRGTTASTASRQLTGQGFTRVVNLRGGLTAWRSEHLPLVRD